MTACNFSDMSKVKVAGGTVDGSDGTVQYPATVYVEMKGSGLADAPTMIRNVGTIVDVGLPGHYALILSLANVFQSNGTTAFIPAFKQVDLTIFLSNNNDSIQLPSLQFTNDGILKDESQRSYTLIAVGLRLHQVGTVDPAIQKMIQSHANRLFLESPLTNDTGINLRDSNTSFVMLSLPKNIHPIIQKMRVPTVMAAEDRPDPNKFNATVVGFGATGGSQPKGQFSLNDGSGMTRNFSPVEPLNKTEKDFTPFRKFLGTKGPTIQQLWEFSGSGLCKSKDGSNYDTGAGVYINNQFAGFGVLSSSRNGRQMGVLDCSSVQAADMTTLVVSPGREHLEYFKSQVLSMP